MARRKAREAAAGSASDLSLVDQVGDQIGTEATNKTTPKQDHCKRHALLAVYSGQVCIGFLMPRRDGVEAYDRNDKLLGTFPDQASAADAIGEAARLKGAER